MSILALSRECFDSVVKTEGLVLVDCWATWCSACKDFAPVFERVAVHHAEHRFATIDTESQPELAEALKVTHIPTLMLYRNGLLLLRQPGYLDENGLNDVIAQAMALDMAVVRAAIEADQDTGEKEPSPEG